MAETPKGFFYALISRGTVVLAEKLVATAYNNLPNIARQLLPKIPLQNHRKSYSYGEQIFHYLVEDSMTVLCVADCGLAHRIAFSFLTEIRQRFRTNFGLTNWQAANELAYNDQFARTLEEQMDFFLNDPSADKIKRVKGQIEEVKTAMQKNMELALDRGDALENLVERTSNLEADAKTFKKKSTELKQKLWWKNVWLWVIIGIIVAVILGLTTVIVLWKLGILHIGKKA